MSVISMPKGKPDKGTVFFVYRAKVDTGSSIHTAGAIRIFAGRRHARREGEEMTIDTTKLRELAMKSEMTAENRDDYPANYAKFIAAANPSTVLALLDELTRTQGSLAIASEALSAAERELQRLRPIEAAPVLEPVSIVEGYSTTRT